MGVPVMMFSCFWPLCMWESIASRGWSRGPDTVTNTTHCSPSFPVASYLPHPLGLLNSLNWHTLKLRLHCCRCYPFLKLLQQVNLRTDFCTWAGSNSYPRTKYLLHALNSRSRVEMNIWEKPITSYRWTGGVWGVTGWSSKTSWNLPTSL